MASKQTTLAVAAFLDSAQSVLLPEPDREGQRALLEPFLDLCREELGTEARLLDREHTFEAVARRLPRRLKRGEPLAPHAIAVLEAWLEFTEAREVVPFAFEVRLGLQDAEGPFLEAVASADTERVRSGPLDPFVHAAAKVGRNDPCSCGSGKKYKKCHGRGQA